MGGENGGEIASALTLASWREALSNELPRRDPGDALGPAIVHTNEVVTKAAKMPGREGMGATLVAVVVRGGHAYVATIGDSRVYVLRGGKLVQVTKDQSFLQYLIDAGEIGRDQIADFPQKNVILQAIGRAPNLAVPIGRIELLRHDTLLLCSDGLTGEVADDTVRGILVEAPAPEAACSRLVQAANAAGGNDNITVLVASASGDRLRVATADDAVSVAEHTYALRPHPT
jgi:PPM family protein phosphatase